VSVEHVRDCSQDKRRKASGDAGGSPKHSMSELDQIRAHGLASVGLSGAPADKKAAAKALRVNQTESELRLGRALLRRFGSTAFRPQVTLRGYIVDFYSFKARLAVEVDGGVHRHQATADSRRDDALRVNRIEVIRFSTQQVMSQLDQVVDEIAEVILRRGGHDQRDSKTPSDPYSWTIYRYGAEYLLATADKPSVIGLLTCRECSAAGPNVNSVTRLCRPCAQRRWSVVARSMKKSVRRPFMCLTCNRKFKADVSVDEVACFRCREQAQLAPLCRKCAKPVESVDPETWCCQRCADVRKIALRSAGSGETPTGPLRSQSSRARWIRGRE